MSSKFSLASLIKTSIINTTLSSTVPAYAKIVSTMQPNYYNGTPGQATPVPQQPQQYQYQYQQSTNIPPQKASNKLLPVTIILGIITLGLIIFIAVDKLIFTSSEEITPEAITTEIFNPLSTIEIPNDDNYNAHMAQALTGRIFTVNTTLDQTIKFTSTEKYEFTYYRDPTADFRKVVSSTHHGKYTVDGEYIKLESGDEFRIVGDYLVKTKDELSKNELFVYFDNYQLYNIANNFNNALNAYFAKVKKNNQDIPTTEKSHTDIDNIICKADYSVITNADAFHCITYYTQYLNEKSVDAIIKKYDYDDYLDYCKTDKTLKIYSEGGLCAGSYAIQNYADLIIRIDDSSSYRITGAKLTEAK